MTSLFGIGEPAAVTLSALEFDVLAEHLGIDPLPLVLKVPSPGRTDVERRRLVDAAWATMADRVGRPVDVNPDVERLMRLLARPVREMDGRLWVGRPLRVLAAESTDGAVLATLSGDTVTLAPADGSGLPRHLLSVLPQAPAGPGASITLPTRDFEEAAKATTPQEFLNALTERGVRDAKTLAEMISDVVGQGQFGAASRDRWGKRHRVDRVVSYFDTAAGRYVQVRKESPSGEPWTTISPADPRRMLQQVTDLLPRSASD